MPQGNLAVTLVIRERECGPDTLYDPKSAGSERIGWRFALCDSHAQELLEEKRSQPDPALRHTGRNIPVPWLDGPGTRRLRRI